MWENFQKLNYIIFFVFTIDNDVLVFVSLKLLFRDDLLSKKVWWLCGQVSILIGLGRLSNNSDPTLTHEHLLHCPTPSLDYSPIRLRLHSGGFGTRDVGHGRRFGDSPLGYLRCPGCVVLWRCHVHLIVVLATWFDYTRLLSDDLLVARELRRVIVRQAQIEFASVELHARVGRILELFTRFLRPVNVRWLAEMDAVTLLRRPLGRATQLSERNLGKRLRLLAQGR